MFVKPVCVPCQRFFRPDRNGTAFIEGMPVENGAEPGTVEPEKWKPYKLWLGDRWVCRGCGAKIIVGVMGGPVSEHYMPEFQTEVDGRGGDRLLQVNDC